MGRNLKVSRLRLWITTTVGTKSVVIYLTQCTVSFAMMAGKDPNQGCRQNMHRQNKRAEEAQVRQQNKSKCQASRQSLSAVYMV